MFNPGMRYGVEVGIEALNSRDTILDCGNQRFDALRQGESFKTTKEYYLSHFKYYKALDVNSKMDAEVVDLNFFIPRLDDSANMVCNSGTSEHVFNQAIFFDNVHRWTKHNGVMVHFLPFTPWLNHGFFNYNPVLFRDIVSANEYEVLTARMCDRNMVGYCDLKDVHYKEKRPVELIKEVERIMNLSSREVMLLYVFKKTTMKSFEYPFQGKYVKDIEPIWFNPEYH